MRSVIAIGAIASLLPLSASAQTLLNMKSQTREVDLSQSLYTKPFKTGTALPATCGLGDMFFKSDAPAGQNLYGCVSPNVWAMQSSGTIFPDPDGFSDLAPAIASPTVLKIGESCPSNPCNARVGNYVYRFTNTANATITAGSGGGIARVYISDAGVLFVDYSQSAGLTVTASSLVARAVASPTVPANAIPIAEVTIAAGKWTNLVDTRAILSSAPMIAGSGIVITQASGRTQIDVDRATVPQLGASNVYTGQQIASAAQRTAPNKIGASDPPACDSAIRETFLNTTTNTLKVCTAPNTWTALSGASVAADGQGYFLPAGNSFGAAQAASGTSASYFLQFVLPFSMRLSKISAGFNAGGTAGQAAAIAIYDAACNKVAGSEVRKVGLDTSGTAFLSVGSAVTLPPGIYYYGFATDSAAASFSNTVPTAQAALVNEASNPRIFSGSAATGSGASLTLPGSCGTKTPGAWILPSIALLP